MAYSIKELARSIQQPGIRDQKKLKHVIRYLAGTATYKFSIRPIIKLTTHDLTPIDLNIYVDSDWAGCHQTRKSTSGFIIPFVGTATSDPFWIKNSGGSGIIISRCRVLWHRDRNSGRTLHQKFLTGSAQQSKDQHQDTDSTAGKSMATRQGVSKRAKHIALKSMFIQQLVQDGIISIHKVPSMDNLADILTKYTTREVLHWLLYVVGIKQH